MLATLLVLSLLAQDCSSLANDIERLACFDSQTKPQEVEPAGAFEPQKDALDATLARSLRDPMSAIDYQVSDVLDCDAVSAPWPGKQCICYTVNSKNGMGGYSGAVVGSALVHEVKPGVFYILPTEIALSPGALKACYAANLTDRPSAKIVSHVRK